MTWKRQLQASRLLPYRLRDSLAAACRFNVRLKCVCLTGRRDFELERDHLFRARVIRQPEARLASGHITQENESATTIASCDAVVDNVALIVPIGGSCSAALVWWLDHHEIFVHARRPAIGRGIFRAILAHQNLSAKFGRQRESTGPFSRRAVAIPDPLAEEESKRGPIVVVGRRTW